MELAIGTEKKERMELVIGRRWKTCELQAVCRPLAERLAAAAPPLSAQDRASLADCLLCQKPTAQWKLMTFQLESGDVLKGPLALGTARHAITAVLATCRAELLRRGFGDELVVVPWLVREAEAGPARYYLRSRGLGTARRGELRSRAATLKTHGGAAVRVLERESTGVVQLSALCKRAPQLLWDRLGAIYWHLLSRFVCSPAVADSGLWNMLAALDAAGGVEALGGVDLEEVRNLARQPPSDFWSCLAVSRLDSLRRLGRGRLAEWRPQLLQRLGTVEERLRSGELDALAAELGFSLFNGAECGARLRFAREQLNRLTE